MFGGLMQLAARGVQDVYVGQHDRRARFHLAISNGQDELVAMYMPFFDADLTELRLCITFRRPTIFALLLHGIDNGVDKFRHQFAGLVTCAVAHRQFPIIKHLFRVYDCDPEATSIGGTDRLEILRVNLEFADDLSTHIADFLVRRFRDKDACELDGTLDAVKRLWAPAQCALELAESPEFMPDLNSDMRTEIIKLAFPCYKELLVEKSAKSETQNTE